MNEKRILVSGSIAYDYIMQYEGVFKDALLKEHLDHLNVAFTAKNRVREFGGCGGNIAYSLSLLGENPILFSVAGSDFDEYEKWLHGNNVDVDFVGRDSEKLTATAYVLTDKRENQITIFSPSAMESTSCEKDLSDSELNGVSLAILSPDICERTARLAHSLVDAGVPYFFDPGQMTPAFSKEDLRFLLENAHGFIANHYEVKLLCDRLDINLDDIVKYVDIFIETLGEKGSVLRMKDDIVEIVAVSPCKVADPT
jgi:adenosine kinase